ncbi:MAG TPA: O-antigen ligase family protein [Kofleriaceae bacterium]|nr:O-antigen ligase family protein [Kofleriaceae bacterium]
MFAIPGIAALIFFILARPQEPFPLLQRVPFLYLFTVLAVLGWVVDVRLRRLQPVPAPTLPWAAAWFLWILLGTAVIVPDQLITRVIEMTLLFALYGTISHGIQRFRTFQLIAGVMAATCTIIALVCLHQGLSRLQCVGGDENANTEEITGIPDGRDCENNEQCRGPDAEPGFQYHCEHVGLLGTYSIEERVRYRGELQDPNEVALTISAGALSLLIGFVFRKRTPKSVFLYGLGAALVLYTVYLTQSRGGLIAGLLVPGVYVVRRYGIKAVVPAGVVALPLLMFGGRSGEAAELSTQLRYEAWAAGLDMFHKNPVFGVGARQFGQHFFMTAHNAFVLTFSELGFPGMVLFVAVFYLSFKSLVVGLRELRQVPGTEAAIIWGMSLFASMAGILFQINTLSFAYHSVLWIFFGLVGAWCSAVRHHRPQFQVRLTWRDLGIIVAACASFVLFGLPLFLKLKGEL